MVLAHLAADPDAGPVLDHTGDGREAPPPKPAEIDGLAARASWWTDGPIPISPTLARTVAAPLVRLVVDRVAPPPSVRCPGWITPGLAVLALPHPSGTDQILAVPTSEIVLRLAGLISLSPRPRARASAPPPEEPSACPSASPASWWGPGGVEVTRELTGVDAGPAGLVAGGPGPREPGPGRADAHLPPARRPPAQRRRARLKSRHDSQPYAVSPNHPGLYPPETSWGLALPAPIQGIIDRSWVPTSSIGCSWRLRPQLVELRPAVLVLGDPLLGEGAALDLGEDLLHLRPGLVGDDPRAPGHVAVLGGVGDREPHVGDAALVDEVDDELHLVEALEVGRLRLVAGVDERLVARLDELGQPAAEDDLLAEEVGLGLLPEGRLEDAAPGAADRPWRRPGRSPWPCRWRPGGRRPAPGRRRLPRRCGAPGGPGPWGRSSTRRRPWAG